MGTKASKQEIISLKQNNFFKRAEGIKRAKMPSQISGRSSDTVRNGLVAGDATPPLSPRNHKSTPKNNFVKTQKILKAFVFDHIDIFQKHREKSVESIDITKARMFLRKPRKRQISQLSSVPSPILEPSPPPIKKNKIMVLDSDRSTSDSARLGDIFEHPQKIHQKRKEKLGKSHAKNTSIKYISFAPRSLSPKSSDTSGLSSKKDTSFFETRNGAISFLKLIKDKTETNFLSESKFLFAPNVQTQIPIDSQSQSPSRKSTIPAVSPASVRTVRLRGRSKQKSDATPENFDKIDLKNPRKSNWTWKSSTGRIILG
ncbi:unnamed protein product [Blepharisma stoltei]|uniref:Uncharacterized protein n=1 Tax=Blepharisma stoltei TaxID=1481888 RepID=A0AAU9J519_9CILI|nr:unnamed protein product [Blepharisma stoltei]